VVNRAFAHKFYGGANPVGRYINKDTLIVGEVADVSVSSGLYPGAPLMSEQAMYVPAAQVNAQFLRLVHVWFQPDWIVRAAGHVQGLTAGMQRALASVDPNLPISGFYSMNDLLVRTLATQRIEVALLGAMAALALVLSAVGIFALVANMVGQRTREIGIRMALGALRADVLRTVLRQGLQPVVAGLIVGLAGGRLATLAIRSALYGVGPLDPVAIGGVVFTLLGAAVLACFLPARRASSVDPAIALRLE
jgi:predicted lysophospholipase L1 biosynthesis ABC-type transport system permease subunit